MFFRALPLLILLSPAALAQVDGGLPDGGDDAGEPDAGTADAGTSDAGEPDAGMSDAGAPADGGSPSPCDPRCEGVVLHYCDGELPALLDCNTLDARCGELSPSWGDDCLLPAGAPCEPGYAFDESRCDRAASLYCIDGACAVASGPQSPPVLEPSAGSSGTSSSSSDDILACSSCSSTSAAGLFILAGALRRLRRLRRS